MSVIIRLQNLPWNANALDIRRFFQGLSIPDGGVHIIGGEKGDAFIAFSTDEDARQAMMSDGGRINGFVIKLLLSSKTEMQNVIAAAKGGPPPPLPAPAAGLALAQQKPPVAGFYDRPVIPPVGGAPVQFVGGNVGGDVTGSGQGLRSSTGLGGSLPGPYGSYPGSGGQVVPQPIAGGTVMGINEPRVLPAAPVVQPAARSLYEARPVDRGPMPGNLQQPPIAPMDPGLRTGLPALPPNVGPVGAWTSPPQDFSRPADIPGNQPPGFNSSFAPGPAREPMRVDAGRMDAARNGNAYGAPPDSGRSFADPGRNFIPGIEPGRNLGPTPVDLGRGMGRVDGGMPSNRPEERGEPPRFMGDPPRWPEREVSGPGQGQSGSGRPFGGRDVDSDPRRDFQRPEADRGFPPPERWMENRGRDMDRGPGAGPLQRGMVGPDDRRDRPPMFGDSQRFGPDSGGPGGPGMGRYPDDRPRGDMRGDYGRPEPGFREAPPRSMMDDPMRQLPPPPDQRWVDDRRDFGPPGPGGRPMSPPRDRNFPGPGFPPRDDPWRGDRPMDGLPWRGERGGPMRDACLRVENFPQTFNYREVRRFFQNVEIPRDGIKLINDRSGMRTGLAFIQVMDFHSLRIALEKSGQMADGRMVSVKRCPDDEFDAAIDGKPLRSSDRSRSPHKRSDGEKPGVTYFVVKKLPLKTEKEDIRKFFDRFKIAEDGGPFFELAFDKAPTGNALIAIAIAERDVGRVLSLKRTVLNGARVDIIKIAYHEFAERSRRARQCEREAEKDGKATASSSSSALKKPDKQETKSKESDRAAPAAAEDDGKQSGGSGGGDGDGRVYCIELRGIPYTGSPAMLQDFFRDIEIPAESIHIVYNREHRASGVAFVEFSSIADQKKALEKNKQHMGHRFVEIRVIGQTAMVEQFNKLQQKFGGALLNLPNKPAAADRPKQGSPVMLSMQNLHYDTQLEDILDFFSGYHPIVDSIKLQYKDGQPTGDGLIEFASLHEADSALRTKNRHLLLGKPITLSWP